VCGFSVSTVTNLESSNAFCQRRGPDLTNTKIVNGIQFLHNLLHITGEVTPQPLIKDDIVCVFNGEIYNYTSFGSYKSDGECIIDLYEKTGEEFVKKLDGEFALCLIDFKQEKIIISVDTFSCKPLWYEFNQNGFCIGSYNSQLTGLGFNKGQKLKSNTTLIFNSRNFSQIRSYENRTFDLRQHKTTFNDWLSAFTKSIQKRTANTTQGMFVGLSSGYDSGAIACELEKQNVSFKAYSIINNENPMVMNERLKKISNTEAFTMTEQEFATWKNELNNNCENFMYDDGFRNYDIKKDQASMGLSAICNRANSENRRIYFSGQGADEIISDYGFRGKKIYKHSGFGGLYPEKLEGFFPWHSFYDGTQIQYLNKEEYVAGHFGIETRYPFLDNDLVQEFLWLTPELKNSKYKSCLDAYLTRNNFPFEPSEKRGFNVVAKGKKMKKAKG
jgi:asparagine synthetase B (glutamine-hydrolysing)